MGSMSRRILSSALLLLSGCGECGAYLKEHGTTHRTACATMRMPTCEHTSAVTQNCIWAWARGVWNSAKGTTNPPRWVTSSWNDTTRTESLITCPLPIDEPGPFDNPHVASKLVTVTTLEAMGPGVQCPELQPATSFRSTFADRWIFLIGDSSLRMLFAALIEAFEPDHDTLADGMLPLPSSTHAKGGCNGHGCLREVFLRAPRLRLTYEFKTFIEPRDDNNASIRELWRELITPAQQPDLLVASLGPWDIAYQHHKPFVARDGLLTPEEGARAALKWLTDELRQAYHRGPIFWLGLNTCTHGWRPDIANEGARFNKAFLDLAASTPRCPRLTPLLYVDRGSSSAHAPLSYSEDAPAKKARHMCEDWHAYGEVAQLHASFVLNGVHMFWRQR